VVQIQTYSNIDEGNILRVLVLIVVFILVAIPAGAEQHAPHEPEIWNKDPSHINLCGKYSDSWNRRIDSNGPGHLYNRLAHGLINEYVSNGFIIALEKGRRSSIGANKNSHEAYLKSFESSATAHASAAARRDTWFRGRFGDPKPLFVSHIYEFTDSRGRAIFNQHQERIDGVRSSLSYQDGMKALDTTFLARLKQRLSSDRYTHVFFMAMGWHNDQRVSICRYRVMVDKIKAAYRGRFNPLIVGMTWPSAWFAASRSDVINRFGHLASVTNKADDADEAGHLYGNIILNRLIPLANRHKIPVVVVGHSFGTRLAGRSIFSREILRQGAIGRGADLAIILQPAHSAFRFAVGKGREGYPFAHIPQMNTKIVVTSSKYDTANPWAFWSRYLGGSGGLKEAGGLRNDFEIIEPMQSPQQSAGAVNDNNKVSVVDAQNFIFNHNDVMSSEVGIFSARLIERYAP
jgi:hypothetical protein